VNSAYTLDDAGRLTGIVNKNSSAVTISYYNYSYDAGNRVSNHTWWSQIGTTTDSGSNTYTYDADSQLLSDSTKNYSFDNNGNRNMTGYQTGTNNRMTNDGVYTYSYDSAGNVIQKAAAGNNPLWTYSYDNLNHMIGATEKGTGGTLLAQETFTYDVQGNLVQQQEYTSTSGTTTTTRFAVDASGNTWADLDSSNNLLVRYLRDANGGLLTRTVGSGANAGVSVYLVDNLGSVRDITNWSGQVGDHIDYTGFGVATESNPSVGDYNKFASYHMIVVMGQAVVGARIYDPSTGRWYQIDPIGFNGGLLDLYDYTGNNPTNATDPSGLQKIEDPPEIQKALKDKDMVVDQDIMNKPTYTATILGAVRNGTNGHWQSISISYGWEPT
jgi:RHS repeat-associated protein